jgi:LPPG:FO 2-phospho-L-lactate transferase
VSINPILEVISFSSTHPQRQMGIPVVAVSPIIGGETVKGPAAKMYRELGIEPSALAVAKHYQGLITHFVLDQIDSQLYESVRGLNIQAFVTNTLMRSPEDRKQLARDVLNFIGSDL